MSRVPFLTGLFLCAGLALLSPTPAVAQPKDAAEAELVEKVKKSIDKGVVYLKKQQSPNGEWPSAVLDVIAEQKGGITALATLALLNSGLKPDDPHVAKALQFLEKLDPPKTYVRALQTMVFAETRLPKYLPMIERNVRWLQEKALRTNAGKLNGWSYPGNNLADNSNTQYALLGLYAAKTAGVKIDEKLWRDILDYYKRYQHTDGRNERGGYWSYDNTDPSRSFTMTVGGTCGLLIANMGLDKSDQELDEATGVAKLCGYYPDNDELAKGLFWVASNFNFKEGKSHYYNMYGLERLGRLSGQRFIGRRDWYEMGCRQLVADQSPVDGSFGYPNKVAVIDRGQPVVTTAFALLFLSKGRTPVLVTKFAWGNFRGPKEDDMSVLVERDRKGIDTVKPDWNRKHNDARNVVDFASRELFDGVPLSWQVYDPRLQALNNEALKIDEEVSRLLQSPVLYLNGHGPMTFVGRGAEPLGAEEKLLQKYVEEGGFLVGEACCGDREFAASFEALIGRIFKGNSLRRMPPEHAIWAMFPGVKPSDFPDLMYLDRGCRTVAVFSPSPLAGYWEEARFIPADGRDPKNRGEKAFCLARNVIAYATGMELPKPKLTRATLVSGKDGGIPRSKFRAVQLKYVSEASVQAPPAADALRNLMAFLGQHAKLDVAMTTEVMTPADDKLSRYKFMYLHGRKAVTFTPEEQDNVKANLQTGGLLLVDAACSEFKQWKEFDSGFRKAMAQMWGPGKLVPIPEFGPDGKPEPLYKIAKDSGIDLKTARCRREKPDESGPEQEMRTYPVLLEGIKVDGRWVVVYSKYDLGCAIEGHKSADCLGYDKESALRIASAVVVYSLRR